MKPSIWFLFPKIDHVGGGLLTMAELPDGRGEPRNMNVCTAKLKSGPITLSDKFQANRLMVCGTL